MNIGEELVADYLQYIKKCEFVQKNLYTEDVQGEIDVVGINLKIKTVYFCEVTIHLVTGLLYVNAKDNKPNNVNKIYDKFKKDIEYARKNFPEYNHVFMLWSPIVKKSSEKALHNQYKDVQDVICRIKEDFGIEIEAIINEVFLEKLQELRDYSANESKDIKSAVMRLYQIEAKTQKYINSKNHKSQQE